MMRPVQLLVLLVVLSPVALAHAQPGSPQTAAASTDPVVHLSAGIGIPELLHGEIGFYALESLSIDVSLGVVVFNLMGGVGATYYVDLSDKALREMLTLSVRARINVLDAPLDLRSGGERLGGTVDALVGYMVVAKSGLFGRIRLGALFYDDSGFAVGPLLLGSAGWRF